MVIVIISADVKKPTELQIVKVGLANRRKGTIGSVTAASRRTSRTAKAIASAIGTSTSAASQVPAASTRLTPIKRGTTVARMRTAPSQSIAGRRDGSGRRLRLRLESANATSPSGTLIQKIQCHDR